MKQSVSKDSVVLLLCKCAVVTLGAVEWFLTFWGSSENGRALSGSLVFYPVLSTGGVNPRHALSVATEECGKKGREGEKCGVREREGAMGRVRSGVGVETEDWLPLLHRRRLSKGSRWEEAVVS